jgi:2-phosphoglycerate kinase
MREIFLSSGKYRWPFSKGLVVESLINAGVGEQAAIAIARSVEQHLLDHQQRLIEPEELKNLVSLYAQRLAGNDLGERFEGQTSTFEEINITDGRSQMPFSRGILGRSLEGAGFSPKAAFQLTKEVDRRLRQDGVHQIDLEGLERYTAAVLESLEGSNAKDSYLNRYNGTLEIEVCEDDSEITFPFSKGILAQSLLATGLSAAYSHRVAREAELFLRKGNHSQIRRQELSELVESVLRREIGDDLGDRYRTLRAVRRHDRPLIVLIGGVSGTGKSYLASEISYRLGITRIVSSDSVREVMRAMISPSLVPTLHASTFTAWKAYLNPLERDQDQVPSREALLQGFREQIQQVSVGLEAIIRRSIEERTSVVVEGVHVAPEYLMSFSSRDAIVVPMLVTVPDEEEHRNHFHLRDKETQQQRAARRYLKHFELIRMMQDDLITRAQQARVPILDGLSLDRAAEGAIEVITQRMLAASSGTERPPKE